MRDSNGRWIAGAASPNPGGRPKASITAALRERVDPAEVAEFLIETMRNPAGRMPERIKAAELIHNRLEGMPLSRSEVKADLTTRAADQFEDLSDEELDALIEREEAALRAFETGGLLPPAHEDVSEADLVLREPFAVPGSEARPPSPEAPPPDSRHDTGPAEGAIAELAAKSERRGRRRRTP